MHPYKDLVKKGVPKGRLMDTLGTGAGDIDLTVNGSVTPVDFLLTVPEGHTYLIVCLSANTLGNPISATGFGGGVALTNGLQLGTTDAEGVFTDLIPQYPIKSNTDFAVHGADVSSFLGSGTDSLQAHVDFPDCFGGYRLLNAGESYTVRVRDDLSTYGQTTVRLGYLDIEEGALVT